MENCHRIYRNGDVRSFLIKDDEEISEWLDENEDLRPGCALVVEDRVLSLGYYVDAQSVLDALNKWKDRFKRIKDLKEAIKK